MIVVLLLCKSKTALFYRTSHLYLWGVAGLLRKNSETLKQFNSRYNMNCECRLIGGSAMFCYVLHTGVIIEFNVWRLFCQQNSP